MRRLGGLLLVLVCCGALSQSAHPCGPDFTIHAYYQSRFWQPLAKTADEAWPWTAPGARGEGQAFAGLGSSSREPALLRVSGAYARLARWLGGLDSVAWEDPQEGGSARHFAEMRQALEEAGAATLPPAEAEELRLVSCKVALREAERGRAPLPAVQSQLQAFLAEARVPRLRSEARGWLARVHYLRGDRHAAAQIYLRELDDPASVFDEDSLLRSLQMVFPYNGSSASLADHLEDYFDHPRHALFVVNLVTNPVYGDPGERAARDEVGRKVLAALGRHPSLFDRGADSAALALALMRAALYQGEPEKARALSERLPAPSIGRAGPEFHWTAGAAAWLSGHEAKAEAHLRAVAESRRAPAHYRAAARQGLIAVYQRQDRMPEALESALRLEARHQADGIESDPGRPWFEFEFTDGWLLDLPYLLDVQASDDDLRQTLDHLGPRRGLSIETQPWSERQRTAQDVLTYALAVRHARREDYAAAARLFERVGAWPRARRMREAAGLHEAAAGGSGPAALEARYRYAAFLADHSTQVFFNDMLWHGYQRYALVDAPPGNLLRSELDRLDEPTRRELVEGERRLRDAQEERWRAYQLLAALAREAGPGELRRRATRKALEALDGINTQRFGRRVEVAEARRRLVAGLRRGGPA
jgi:hypothetical protein